jgi:hypothetical protein
MSVFEQRLIVTESLVATSALGPADGARPSRAVLDTNDSGQPFSAIVPFALADFLKVKHAA